jgi:hypothetical protein
MKLKSRLVVVLTCVMLQWLGATPAGAGTFEVLACDAAPGFANNSWRPDVNHGGMVAFTACPSGDNRMLGLGLRNGYYPSGWTVPRAPHPGGSLTRRQRPGSSGSEPTPTSSRGTSGGRWACPTARSF